ncbi:hypothetical protein NQ314_007629 [Rhamnusium bicolor]|uniref:PiggyBac transposable element-derived protein domain-containing protein n=1 Tax=Rhamnusium bicolor TaxID=1586634 RepID=A0AAV8YL13_9CUCU|nr:hypothetical protein NQ314_007629 [Rhamnusium bicolor]
MDEMKELLANDNINNSLLICLSMASQDPKKWMEWLKEIEEEEQILGEIDLDEDESNYCEESNHNSDSEEDANEDVEIDEHIPDNDDGVPYSLGKDKVTQWKKVCPPKTRTKVHNIFDKKPGPVNNVANAKTILECFEIFFTEKIIQAVTQSINIYIDDIKEKCERDRDAKPTVTCEIRALLGMLYLLGVFLSTTHVDDKIDPESEKPMMIVDYNNTKYGVDVVDQMCASHSVARNSRRWPLTVFFNMMNIGGINTPVLYQLNNHNNPIVRREFLRTLALNLLKPYISGELSIYHTLKVSYKANYTVQQDIVKPMFQQAMQIS